MTAPEWYYTQNNQQQGPVTLEALQGMAANGQLQRTDLVWRQGMADWQSAGDLPGLFGGAPAAPTAWQGPSMGGAPSAPTAWQGPSMGGAPVGHLAQTLGYGYSNQGPSLAAEAKEAMIYSLIGVVCCGIVLGPVGLVKGLNVQKQMQATGNYEGKGMATAAVVIGIIVTLLSAIGVISGILGRAHHLGR